MIKGVPISPGVSVARAYRMDDGLSRTAPENLSPEVLATEVTRFESACDTVFDELSVVIDRVSREINEDAARIFRAHQIMVRDPALTSKVKSLIVQHKIDAATALQKAIEEYETIFSRIKDTYLQDRIADIRDVVQRLINQLTMRESILKLQGSEPVVIVAADLQPSQAIMFDQLPLAGIITEAGGSTGHAAILARSLGIPAVSGLKDLLKYVHTGDTIIVDGREGIIEINPGPEVESAYRKLQREYVDLREKLVENRDLAAITTDGQLIELHANVNNVLDAAAGVGVGACGVGLFRTEFVFLTHTSVPDEEEQVAAYRSIIEASPNQTVVIRTLDLGGDKQVPYLTFQREANPFMGWRSIRMCSDHPEFFQTQLRAILRAGVYGKVKILFPMVSMVEEVQKLKRLVERARMTLHSKQIPYSEDVPFGVMIEIPAAAMCIEHILEVVDFVSIGSNDLIQYIMAADRDNPKVAHLCEPCHPAVFQILSKVIRACVNHDKPVTLCGEMAGRPMCLLPLLGMGLTRVSISPAFVPTIKEMIRTISLRSARKVAKRVKRMKSIAEVRSYLSKRLRKLCPNVAKLDTL